MSIIKNTVFNPQSEIRNHQSICNSGAKFTCGTLSIRLPLLPSGPGGVHRLSLRRAWPRF